MRKMNAERGNEGGRAGDGCEGMRTGAENDVNGSDAAGWLSEGLENAKQVLGRAAELWCNREKRSESAFRTDAESVADHTQRRDETHLSAGHTGRERVLRDGNLFVDEVIRKVVGSAAGDSRAYKSVRRAGADLANAC